MYATKVCSEFSFQRSTQKVHRYFPNLFYFFNGPIVQLFANISGFAELDPLAARTFVIRRFPSFVNRCCDAGWPLK